MTNADLTLWVQAIAVVVAVLASIVALFVSWRDRVAVRTIAAEDRRATLEQAKLMFDLDALLRLLKNRNRGGSNDAMERGQLGAEALTLVGMLGSDLLPRQWAKQVDADDDKLRLLYDDPTFPEWKKDAAETQIALNQTLRRLAKLVQRE